MTEPWSQRNHRLLLHEVAHMGALLRAHLAQEPPPPFRKPRGRRDSALDFLCQAFDINDAFERLVLLLCVAVESDKELADLCAKAQDGDKAARPTIGLALAALPGAHWRALAADSPLRRHELLRVDKASETVLSPIGLDEAVLHFLLHGHFADAELAGIAERLNVPPSPVESHHALAERIGDLFQASDHRDTPIVQLSARSDGDALAVAALAARAQHMKPYRLSASALPTQPAALSRLARLWVRQARLDGALAVLDLDGRAGPEAQEAAVRFAEQVDAHVLLVGRHPPPSALRPMVKLEVEPLAAADQRRIWHAELSDRLGAAPEPEIVFRLAARFDLDVAAIRECAAAAQLAEEPEVDDGTAREGGWSEAVWESCRTRARPQLEHLAERLKPNGGWERLVLPEDILEALRDLHDQVWVRGPVREALGKEGAFRGKGITALFAGPSGTGKTLAAEVLAFELGLDVYRIDLASVVSKYIGETEKNLGRLFDAAESGGAVLLFDEADSLFGKRGDVKDSHDRHANIEVGYLLQRMESFGGLAILTTNLKENMDQAFQRRLSAVVEFPSPDEEQRAAIWHVTLPPGVEWDTAPLGKLQLTGGQIAAAANNALCLAAAQTGSLDPADLRPAHLQKAVRAEYRKMSRLMSHDELAVFTRLAQD